MIHAKSAIHLLVRIAGRHAPKSKIANLKSKMALTLLAHRMARAPKYSLNFRPRATKKFSFSQLHFLTNPSSCANLPGKRVSPFFPSPP
jgi:hypothetical protein